MKNILLIIVIIFFYSCHSDNKIIIPCKFYSHLQFYKANDTIYFQNENKDVDTFLITTIDSGMPPLRLVMAEEPHKFIRISYHKIPVIKTKKLHEIQPDTNDITLLELAKYPNYDTTQISVKFQGFTFWAINSMGIIRTDTVINNLKIKDFYLLNQSNVFDYDDSVPDSLIVTNLIWTDKQGIVAYKCKNEKVWTRLKK